MEITTREWAVAGRLLTVAAGSVVGNRYRDNFDVLRLGEDRPFAVVADGMGDGPGSTAAGRTTVDVFVRATATATGSEALRSAVAEVQSAVRDAGRGISGLTGCTLTAFVADPGAAEGWIVQLGDSRAYRLRERCFELLTTDHTDAWLGVLNGWYAPDSREAYLARHRLTRFAGHPGLPEPDLLNVSLRAGDLLLLCTDGVSDQLDDRAVGRLLTEGTTPAGTVERLLSATLAHGGDDNATAVVIAVR